MESSSKQMAKELVSSPGWGWAKLVPEVFRIGGRVRQPARLLALAMLVGVVAGVGGIAFYLATRIMEHYALGVVAGYWPEPRPGGEGGLSWLEGPRTPLHLSWLLLVPTLGGLVSGALVFWLAPEAKGHGTDAAIAAYHSRGGEIRPRVPLVKMAASTITLGTGGSGGREGPIAQIGAGFGSVLAQMLRLRTRERRILMAAGMGAGIGAVFRAPLAGTLFAAEVLYQAPEFEPEVIIPAGIASVVSYCTFSSVLGWRPLFTIPELSFSNPWQLGPYLILALFTAALASLYVRTFYGCERFFDSMQRVPRAFRPAMGALLTGLVAVGLFKIAQAFGYACPEQTLAVLGFGYSAVQDALLHDGGAGATVLLAIALGKILTTSLTIGSGGSGGVFGPSMVIGGCAGGALGIWFHQLWPDLVPHPASFVVVGMAGFFSAAAKTPFSTLIIVSEMTGGYRLLLPALWVCTISYVLSGRKSLYASQVESRARSPAHQGELLQEILAEVRVGSCFRPARRPIAIRPQEPLEMILQHVHRKPTPILPVLEAEDRLVGVVALEEVVLAAQTPALRPLVVAEDLMRTDIEPLIPEDTLDVALERLVASDLGALPVVENLLSRRFLGIIHRSEIIRAYLQRLPRWAAR
ncbi:MAG TPA: chloride channel protein [Thermoguttaceae bacterium]|nr:chloride channel protein [Thermoguttaceae bacterium]